MKLAMNADNDLLFEPEIDTPEVIKPPPKRWRNRYALIAGRGIRFRRRGGGVRERWRPPGVYWGHFVHPSADIAATNAAAFIKRHPRSVIEYRGAFPEDAP